jgi:hypothetical protein
LADNKAIDRCALAVGICQSVGNLKLLKFCFARLDFFTGQEVSSLLDIPVHLGLSLAEVVRSSYETKGPKGEISLHFSLRNAFDRNDSVTQSRLNESAPNK